MKNAVIFAALMIYSAVVFASGDFFKLINDGEEIHIRTSDLEKMPAFTIRTSTNFTPSHEFTGVRFGDLTKKYHIGSGMIRVFAWDNYSYTIPVGELLTYNVILAYKKDGNYMDISDLGPYAIIYPRDSYSELNTIDINAKTVWQVKQIEILP